MIGGAPALALLLLLMAGWVKPLPGVISLVVTAATALMLARLWLGNLARLKEAIRRAEMGESEEVAPPGPALLPSVEEIADAMRRLARSVNERAELVLRLRQADEAIVERLPDPLVVLDARGGPLRANDAARALFGSGAGMAGDLAALLRHPTLAEALDQALAGGGTHEVDIALPVPVPRDLKIHVIPMDPPLADGGRLVLLLSDRTRDRLGARARMLDLYGFAALPIGDKLLDVRVGNQVVSWGESLFFPNTSGAQSPADATKSNVPGTEVKDILLPLG
jgi:two-component system phosphate regulon sensor histidine kinase PhoR